MRTHKLAGAAAALLATGVLMSGCTLPDASHRPNGADTEVDTGADTGTGNGTPFTDPQRAEIYKELNRDLRFRGGDKNGPCGEWQADTPEDAAVMRKAHQRCLDEGWYR